MNDFISVPGLAREVLNSFLEGPFLAFMMADFAYVVADSWPIPRPIWRPIIWRPIW